MTTFRFEKATNDADEAIVYLHELHAGLALAPRMDRFAMRVSGAGEERFSSLREGLAPAGTLTTVAPASIVVLETASGAWGAENGRQGLDTTRPILDAQRAGAARWDRPFSVFATHINPAALDELAANHFNLPGLHVKFSAVKSTSPVHDRTWRATSAFVREIVGSEAMLENQLIRDSTFRAVAASLMANFPNNTLDLADPTDGARAAPTAIRRAIAFMEENIAVSIQLEDVALAARMSARGLQEAFVREVGTSPMRQLRLMRLEAARADLLLADRTGGDTVATVALRWGFSHLARFSATYFEQFGEYPAHTLRH